MNKREPRRLDCDRLPQGGSAGLSIFDYCTPGQLPAFLWDESLWQSLSTIFSGWRLRSSQLGDGNTDPRPDEAIFSRS